MIPGQRWVSDSEPELGLGMLLKVEHPRVEVLFPAVEETRVYAIESAPLRRVEFREGDSIETHEGVVHMVQSSHEDEGLLIYQTDKGEVAEAELSDNIGFLKPEDRLYGGQVDEDLVHALRVEALRRNAELKRSEVRGFIGGKIDLIPHQLGIAYEVCSRRKPRVLLADEVGLGKTIEACLILHRLHLMGRADRVLILMPEPLMNQWFVELLRKFNLLFSVFDEERCASIEAHSEDNPFLDSQLVICSTELLAENSRRAGQVVAAGWDLLIVDEAHHLEWSEEEVSSQYQVVEELAQKTAGLVLLTATPEQLGESGHYARLRLLDSERFSSLAQFQEETQRYEGIAALIERVQKGDPITEEDWQKSGIHEKEVAALSAQLSQKELSKESGTAAEDESKTAENVVSGLLDCFGTGRVMFRNTRERLKGFPKRIPKLYPLEGSKLDWLVDTLDDLGEEKVLLICESKELVEELAEGIQERVKLNVAVFHEELSLIQRDRNAAYFAEPDGARILLCSEIGSEGRNFQFVHHLVLYDLPLNPELLEQRIGRLDRIGQTEDIQIHVPYSKGEREELLALWYHEGLGALSECVGGVPEILAEVGDKLVATLSGEGELADLISETKACAQQVGARLNNGYDKLLEMNSNLSAQAERVIEGIEEADSDSGFEKFLIRLFDVLGLAVTDLENRSYLIQQGNVVTSAFPNLPEEGLSITFDRSKALSRDDLTLLTSDHPLARAAMDSILGTELGNTNFNVWEDESGVKQMILDAEVVAEVLAPAALEVDRFFPPVPIQVILDHRHQILTGSTEIAEAELRAGGIRKLMSKPVVKTQVIPGMLRKIEEQAKETLSVLVDTANSEVKQTLDAEIARLRLLAEKNGTVPEEEIELLEEQEKDLLAAIDSARLRLDTLRLLWRQ